MRYLTTSRETWRLDPETRQNLRGEFIELADGVTHYELSGPVEGDLVVLTGGLTVPLFYWDALVPELHARGLRTLTFSGYGRGFSARVRVAYNEALFVRQLHELLEALDLRGAVHVVGTSMGAIITGAYALAHPNTIATLTFIGPAGLARRLFAPHRLLRSDRLAEFVARRWGYRVLEGHLGHNVSDPRQSEAMTTMVLDAFRCEGSLHALFDTLQHVPLFGRAELYRRVGGLLKPTLLLWGAQDTVTPVRQLAKATTLLRAREHQVISEAGHMAAFERPSEVGAHLARFVRAHVTTGATI